MKNLLQKVVVCLVTLSLGIAALAYPVSATQSIRDTPEKNCAPIVLVHGLGGWGEGTKLYDIVPYWGAMGGDIKAYLNKQGYEAYAASLSPIASTWDRACELYAHLTGTRTDYGEAHAKAHGHERYGPEYDTLGPDWPAESIHLVGHSYGGATIRLFAQLCAEGSVDERKATPTGELSPLFNGTLGGNIVSITAVSSPLNGTTAMLEPVKGVEVDIIEISLYTLAAMDDLIPGFGEYYPARLQQFGSSTNVSDVARKLVEFSQSVDSAQHDLSVDGAKEVNRGIHCQPDIFYFSYASDTTRETVWGSHVPKAAVTPLLLESSLLMGQKREPMTTSGGTVIDKRWMPNDGLVNTISAQYPFEEPYKDYDAKNVETGVWQVMPIVKDWDHIAIVGGMRPDGASGVMEFYLALAQMLERLPQ